MALSFHVMIQSLLGSMKIWIKSSLLKKNTKQKRKTNQPQGRNKGKKSSARLILGAAAKKMIRTDLGDNQRQQ